jgi:hypothetical protein
MRANEKAFVFQSDAEAAAAQVTSLESALEAAAFAIDKVSGMSSYVKGSDNRYHIFQLAEREQDRVRPLNEVWDQIKQFLLVQKLQHELEALRSRAKLETFPERLGAVTQVTP